MRSLQFKKKLASLIGTKYPISIGLSGDDECSTPHARVSYRGVEISNTRGKRQLPSHLFDFLIKASIEEFKARCLEKQIAFC